MSLSQMSIFECRIVVIILDVDVVDVVVVGVIHWSMLRILLAN